MKVNALKSLSIDVSKETAQVSLLRRVGGAICLVKEQKGILAAVGTAAAVGFGALYTGVFSYFCMEGTVRSFMEVDESVKEHGRPTQAIGDAGGWTSLPIFSFYSFKRLLTQLAKEKDFVAAAALCRVFCSQGQNVSLNSVYLHVNSILDGIAPQCITYKSVISRRLIALDMMSQIRGKVDGELALDMRLKSVYEDIEKAQRESFEWGKYFSRIQGGLHVDDPAFATSWRISRVASGLFLPLVLGANAAWSAVGEYYLGEKLFERREDLPEVGHFGEWPDNVVASSAFGFWLHRDLLVKGDLFKTAVIFQKELDELMKAKDQDGYNRLVAIANEEMKQLASLATFSRPAMDNYFLPYEAVLSAQQAQAVQPHQNGAALV